MLGVKGLNGRKLLVILLNSVVMKPHKTYSAKITDTAKISPKRQEAMNPSEIQLTRFPF